MISVLVDVIHEARGRCGISHCTELKAGPVTPPSISKLFSLHFLPHYFTYPIILELQQGDTRISYDLSFCIHEVQSRRE